MEIASFEYSFQDIPELKFEKHSYQKVKIWRDEPGSPIITIEAYGIIIQIDSDACDKFVKNVVGRTFGMHVDSKEWFDKYKELKNDNTKRI